MEIWDLIGSPEIISILNVVVVEAGKMPPVVYRLETQDSTFLRVYVLGMKNLVPVAKPR